MAGSVNRRMKRAIRRPKDNESVKDAVKIARTCKNWVIVGIREDVNDPENYEMLNAASGFDDIAAMALFLRMQGRVINLQKLAIELTSEHGYEPEVAMSLARAAMVEIEKVDLQGFYGPVSPRVVSSLPNTGEQESAPGEPEEDEELPVDPTDSEEVEG